jgi:hypothetical protein
MYPYPSTTIIFFKPQVEIKRKEGKKGGREEGKERNFKSKNFKFQCRHYTAQWI